ncbi:MAG TPA: DUF58 domain-containing protein [Rugosimonospora sp.]
MTWRPAALLAAGAVLVPFLPMPRLVAVLIIAAVAVLSIVDVVVAAALVDVRLTRDGDRQVRLGESAHVTLTVSNNGERVLHAEIRDAWVPSAGAVGPYSHRVSLAPGSSARLATRLHPTRRGDRPAVRVSVRSFGPMGLAYRQYPVRRADAATPQWTVRVLPPFTSRRFLPEKMARLRMIDGIVVTRGRGQGTEFDTLREYVLGDDVRSVDWRASARRSDVVVRTWRPERDRRVLCVIDTGRTSAVRVGGAQPRAAADLQAVGDPRSGADSPAGGDPLPGAPPLPGGEPLAGGGLNEPRLDAAIDAALLLATLASRAGDRVDLLAIDTAVRAAVDGGAVQTLPHRLAGALATLHPALVETDFGLVVSEILRRERKRALVVLFTALEPGALGEGLLPVLAQLTSRHKVLVAAVHDPAVTDLTVRRGDAAGVYAAAAAHRTLAERDRIVTALGRNQVEVVDAPVQLFASRVADAYLAMKAAGRL